MITLIIGGSGSGKSAYAEQVVMDFGDRDRIYIATMFPFDEESRRRIDRHRRMRAEKNFTTIECYTGLKTVEIPEGACVLLECMSNLMKCSGRTEQRRIRFPRFWKASGR